MSVRASTTRCSICSGAMYAGVPARTLSWVRVRSSLAVPPPSAGRSLASPKSSSFAPDRVSITLPGLRSRCTTPRAWAAPRASAISIP